MTRVCLQFVIVVFPYHIHLLLFEKYHHCVTPRVTQQKAYSHCQFDIIEKYVLLRYRLQCSLVLCSVVADKIKAFTFLFQKTK